MHRIGCIDYDKDLDDDDTENQESPRGWGIRTPRDPDSEPRHDPRADFEYDPLSRRGFD